VSEDSALPKKTVTYFSWYMKLAEIRTATFRHGEPYSEALWGFGNCFKSTKEAARAREAIEQLLMTLHTPQT
jgi:hypothetical protein